ncbi:DUF6565 domain-containing protein [Pontibacter anaerobius]|uniref:Uncharacterized protein n=1 Tax=Pontibacter anaerobius TaxID=2993940 RepID=A0ABT3RHM0_9BACT|nr:DUF6565 domain-containing protein [Pontibacter anaerobius]MCX2741117.1 hypothetical protein [Pontibacter anaerobius]
MKKAPYTLRISFVVCFVTLLWSCDGRREVEGEDEVAVTTVEEDTATVVRSGESAEEELEEFRGWLNKQAAKGDTAIRREWPGVKEELRRRNARLESKFDSLSEESKAEYRELQNRYEQWEERQKQRMQQPLDAKQVAQWQEQLLREYDDLSKLQASQMREAYLTFMGTVRTKRSNWTQNDWDYVDHVYSQLNQRRRQLESQISTSDKLKIRTLQAEYLTLEGAADTQDMFREVEE